MALVVTACAVFLISCGDRGAVDLSAQQGAVAVHHPARITPDNLPLNAMEIMRIGATDAAGGHAFGRIRGLLMAVDGRMYVLDDLERTLSIFDPSGSLVRTVGRAGGGPGEFDDPRGMTWGPDSTIWVMDFANQRYTIFDRSGDLVTTIPREVPPTGTDWHGFLDSSGALFDITYATRGDARASQVLVRFDVEDSRLVAVDTILLPPQPDTYFWIEGSAGILRLDVPFAARPSWAFDGQDALWIGSGIEFRLVRQRLSGDTIGIITWDLPPEPVSSNERREARRELEFVVAELRADPRALDFSMLPAFKPAHGRIRIDESGNLWVQRASHPAPRPAGSPLSVFDVFRSSGAYVGALELPVAGNMPMAFSPGRVSGVSRDELGIQHVLVFTLTR